jgi:murein DD-endopeptidase MepM/ murein hydrolase activator NlpD
MFKAVRSILVFAVLFTLFSPAQAQEIPGPVYIVQAGDSLSSIAARFSITLTELMAANGITDPNQLAEGQQLVIPGLEGLTGSLVTQVINFGDSYRSLMRRTQVPPAVFNKLNHVVSPSEFYVGASMIVPAQAEDQFLEQRLALKPGESLLELAVRGASDPWTLAHYNDLDISWSALPGDSFFGQGAGSAEAPNRSSSAFIGVEIRGLPLKQGGTAVVEVAADRSVTLGGLLIDHALHFFPAQDGTQIALQGVHALLEPGVYPLRIDAAFADGSRQSHEQFVVVISGNYPEDPLLYVDPATIDPASSEPELRQLIDLTLPANPTRYWAGDFISPAIAYAESTYFTSRFGNRRTYIGEGTDLRVPGFHTGLDFGGGEGLPITSPAAGLVVFAGPLTVRGNATIIDHGWGVYSGFWHQSQVQVQAGQTVEQNQVIGLVGGTGRVTGAHLHWELWVNGVQVDPLDWLTTTYP